MATEHVNIPDGERHEPKGASSASIGSAYVSNGAGSGSWQRVLVPNDIRVNYGQMLVTRNIATINSFSGDIDQPSTYVKWATGWSGGAFQGSAITFNVDRLDIHEAGHYTIDIWTSVVTEGGGSSSNKLYALTVSIDNATTGISSKRVLALSDFSGDIRNPCICGGHLELNIGDSVSLWLCTEDSGYQIGVLEGSLSLTKLG